MWNQLDSLARRQHGLVTVDQLHGAGFGRRAILTSISAGRFIRVRPRVLRIAGTDVTRRQTWLAAVLSARAGVVLSHGCAAALWCFRGFPDPEVIDLLTTGQVRPQMTGVRAHFTKQLPDHHRTKVTHIPVTSAARSLVDACGLVPFPLFERALDDLLRRNALRLPVLAKCAEEVPVPGRRKISPVRRALAERVPGYNPGGSDAELDVLRGLRRAGLPLPVQQYRVELEGKTFVLDYAWPETKHCLEYQGKAWHAMASDFHRDYERFRILQRHGWRPWPLTSRTTSNELVAIATEACAGFRAA